MSCKWKQHKKAGMAILISDKVHFKGLARENGRHVLMIRINKTKGHNSGKHLHTQHRCTNIYKANNDIKEDIKEEN